MAAFSASSKKQLDTCDERLQRLFNEVIKHYDCVVLEGKRTAEQQEINLAKGASKTRNSKHVTGDEPSLAADVAPYPIDWKNYKRFYLFAGFVLGVASRLGIQIRWGGDWDSDKDMDDQTFNDLVHFEVVG